jgi:hypothetical protein
MSRVAIRFHHATLKTGNVPLIVSMTERRLSEAAEQFLNARIGSMLHLEILLVLRRDAQQWATPASLAAALRVSVESTERALEHIGAANLIDVKIANSLAYRFAPIDDRVRPLIDEIAAVHYEDRQALEVILTRRGGSEAARAFADAFRLPQRKPDA